MLRTLVKKELTASFRSYFVNPKTGKARSKGRTAAMFLLFAFLMLFLCSISFGMTYMLENALADLPFEIDWMLYTLMGAGTILLGVFGSVFNTFASLYQSKDNEFLLSMPIRPRDILLSRLSLVYVLSLLYCGIVWLPMLVCIWVIGHTTILSVLFGILLYFIISLLVTVITCALGWVIALIAGRIRSKSMLVMLLSVAFFIVYYYVCFNLSSVFEQLLSNIAGISDGLRKWGGPLYALGLAGQGSISGMLIFSGFSLLLAVLCFGIMSRTYAAMLMQKPKASKRTVSASRSHVRGVRSALFLRELQRLTSSAAYMMNAGFGIIIMLILSVLAIAQAPTIRSSLAEITGISEMIAQLLPVLVPFSVCMMAGLDFLSLPSVSLEGKHLWILQTIPVPAWQVLRAKRDIHLLLNTLPAMLLALVLAVILGFSVSTILSTMLFIMVFNWLNADLGLMLGIQHANLTWTSETIVIKQNMYVFVIWVVNLLLLGLTAASAVLLSSMLSPAWILLIGSILLAFPTLLTEKWLRTKGCRLFSTL